MAPAVSLALAAALSIGAALAAPPASSTRVAPGESVAGSLPAGSPDATFETFRLQGASGPVVVDAMAYDFDVFLTLSRQVGNGPSEPFAEDDDSGIATNARVAFEARAGEIYEIVVRPIVDDWGGEFELAVSADEEGPDEGAGPETESAFWREAVDRAVAEDAMLAERVRARLDAGEDTAGAVDLPPAPWRGSADERQLERLARALHGLGTVRLEDGEWESAATLFQDALSVRESLRAEHPRLLGNLVDLGQALLMAKRYSETLPIQERALRLSKELHGELSQETALRYGELANTWSRLKRPDVALPLRRAAARIVEQGAVDDPYWQAFILTNLAHEYWRADDWREAALRVSAVAQLLEKNDFPPDGFLLGFHRLAASAFLKLGSCSDNLYHLKTAAEIAGAVHGEASSQRLAALLDYGNAAYFSGRAAESRVALETALEIARASRDSPNLAACHLNLGSVYRSLEMFPEAIDQMTLARELESRPGADVIDLARVEHALGRAYLESGDASAALPHLEAAVRVWRGEDGDGSHRLSVGLRRLAEALHAVGRKREARAVGKEARRMDRAYPASDEPCVTVAH